MSKGKLKQWNHKSDSWRIPAIECMVMAGEISMIHFEYRGSYRETVYEAVTSENAFLDRISTIDEDPKRLEGEIVISNLVKRGFSTITFNFRYHGTESIVSWCIFPELWQYKFAIFQGHVPVGDEITEFYQLQAEMCDLNDDCYHERLLPIFFRNKEDGVKFVKHLADILTDVLEEVDYDFTKNPIISIVRGDKDIDVNWWADAYGDITTNFPTLSDGATGIVYGNPPDAVPLYISPVVAKLADRKPAADE